MKIPVFFLLWWMLPLFSFSQACPKVKLEDFPAADLPKGFDTAGLATHSSYKYYYGIGRKVDYAAARLQAFIEMKWQVDEDEPFSGAAILMMLYANGYGVKRDLALAIRLACANVYGANAETEGRVAHLEQLQSGADKKAFDICDDITSGLMMGYCEGLNAEKEAIKRKAVIASVIRNWPQKDRNAYENVRKAATAFFDQLLASEVDMSGTARAAEQIGASESLEAGFTKHIQSSDNCSFPAADSVAYSKLDKQLNIIYSKLMSQPKAGWGTVTSAGIRQTQRAWIRYRDAWLLFCTVRCPGTSVYSLNSILTNERIAQLKDISGD